MRNLYLINERVVISAIDGDLPTESKVTLPSSCLIFGVGGSFYIQSEKEKTLAENCFYIRANTTFKVNQVDCKGFVIIFFDAVSPEHSFLSSKYIGLSVTRVGWKTNENLLNKAFSKMNEAESNGFLDKLFKELFQQERKALPNAYDNRISIIDQYIRKNIREKISNGELASTIHLSESRFYHFFKEQTEVNVSNYILWLRLKIIFESYLKSDSKLNKLLELSNFTDLSHLIKSFKSFFGESPKRLLKK